MINGKYPVIIFQFAIPKVLNDIVNLKGVVDKFPIENFLYGVPIPVYLNEEITHIAVATENQTMTWENEEESDKIFQTTARDEVAINFVADIESSGTSTLLALIKLANQILNWYKTTKDPKAIIPYKISYFSKRVNIYNGVLANFTTLGEQGTTRMGINVTIANIPPKADKDSSKNPTQLGNEDYAKSDKYNNPVRS